MYLWLFIVVGLIYVWLVGGTLSAWRTRRLGGWLATGSCLTLTGIAAIVILFAGPYWQVIYWVLLQPG